MRDDWKKPVPTPALSRVDAERLVRAAFPRARVVVVHAVAGGLANATYRVDLAERRPVCLRLYQRNPEGAATERALSRLVRERAPGVPVPEFHHLGDDPATGHRFAVQDWIEGATLAAALRRHAGDEGVGRALGAAVGATLAAIAAIGFPQAGFLGERLDVVTPIDLGGAAFVGMVQDGAATEPAAARLGPALGDRLRAFVANEAPRLDGFQAGRAPCLTHADFDATNLLVAAAGSGYRVAGVLDWEFAFAGSVVYDLGHALRPPGGTAAGFVAGLEAGFTAAGGALPAAWQAAARLADLLAWLDFLGRPDAGAGAVASALAVIAATCR